MKQLIKDIHEGHSWKGLNSFLKRRHLIGYLIIVGVFLGSVYTLQEARKDTRQRFEMALTINCQRTNALSDQRAGQIYYNYANLVKNGKLLGIKITPELENQVIIDSNRQLKQLKHFRCDIVPPKPPEIEPYPPITKRKK